LSSKLSGDEIAGLIEKQAGDDALEISSFEIGMSRLLTIDPDEATGRMILGCITPGHPESALGVTGFVIFNTNSALTS
jgi:hypothetical protein